jgi:putative folate metabolism gamma-glutamate ligase
MIVTALKTPLVGVNDELLDLLDETIPELSEDCIVVVTSKIVSLCEGSVMPRDGTDKEELVINESDLYMPQSMSPSGFHFTIVDNTLISMAGVDESNAQDVYVLWPKDAQASANAIRHHLAEKHGLRHVGVIITDSTHRPLRRGSTGICLAHSGFNALKDYVGTPDLFDRPFAVSKASISGGLAAAAVVVMGEGRERTPLALIKDVPFVEFQERDPDANELAEQNISVEEDMFGPFLRNMKWQPGKRHSQG